MPSESTSKCCADGFSFAQYKRNASMYKQGFKPPVARKTGTTIAGIVFKDGVILGADTRATEDTIVADKDCRKIHFIIDNIYCGGAGTAADTVMVSKMISSKMALHKYELNGRTPRVATALTFLKQHLFSYQGYIGAALVLGGVDSTGAHLHTVYPHGSVDTLPYVTMGSGSLAAMAVFEKGYKMDLDKEEGMQLVRNGIAAGILNDLGSGSNVDLCVIMKDKTEYYRGYEHVAVKGQRAVNYTFPPGTTSVLSEQKKPIAFDIVEMTIKPLQRMDVDEDTDVPMH